MDADGKNVRRLTHTPGYDGGAFFNRRLHADRLARLAAQAGQGARRLQAPAARRAWCGRRKLELYVANADGIEPRAGHLPGRRLVRAVLPPDRQNAHPLLVELRRSARGASSTLGHRRRRHAPRADHHGARASTASRMFSPDGKRWRSRRTAPRAPGAHDTNVFVADWAAARRRAGRRARRRPHRRRRRAGSPTRRARGAASAPRGWRRRAPTSRSGFKALGLEPAGDDGSFPPAVPGAHRREASSRRHRGAAGRRRGSRETPSTVLGFSAIGERRGAAGAAPATASPTELRLDDYATRREGEDRASCAASRPSGAPLDDARARSARCGDLRQQGLAGARARRQGADGGRLARAAPPARPTDWQPPDEAPLPRPRPRATATPASRCWWSSAPPLEPHAGDARQQRQPVEAALEVALELHERAGLQRRRRGSRPARGGPPPRRGGDRRALRSPRPRRAPTRWRPTATRRTWAPTTTPRARPALLEMARALAARAARADARRRLRRCSRARRRACSARRTSRARAPPGWR